MGHWWRAYDEAVDDPKLQLLPPPLFKVWFNLLCLASRNNGVLPHIEAIAFNLRTTEAKIGAAIEELVTRGLLDEFDGALRPHNWSERQFSSDSNAAERQRRYRERHRNAKSDVTRDVTVTVQDTDTDTDTERKKEEDTADAVTLSKVSYAFESGIIRLKEADFRRWKEAFSHLDLAAELIGLSAWAAEQGPKRWFQAVSGALAKRNRQIGASIERNSKFRPMSGMEGII